MSELSSTSWMEHNNSHNRAISLSAPQQKVAAELEPIFDELRNPSAAGTHVFRRLELLSRLKQILADFPDRDAQNTFRQLGGFSILLDALKVNAGYFDYSIRSDDDKRTFVEYIKGLFLVLSQALRAHPGNQRFFARKVGYGNLEQALAATGLPVASSLQTFGILFSFALDDETQVPLFTSIARNLPSDLAANGSDTVGSRNVPIGEGQGSHQESSIDDDHQKTQTQSEADLSQRKLDYVRQKVQNAIGSKELLSNPAIVPVIFNFHSLLEIDDLTSAAVLQALLTITTSSKHNLVSMHGTGLLTSLLPRVLNVHDGTAPKRLGDPILLQLTANLIELGFNRLEDAKLLYRRALFCDGAAEFLLEAMKTSRSPFHIQFDLAIHGFSSLELPNLGHTFPPTATPGYTLSMWLCVDRFDKTTHTTLFGAFDSSQKCFLLAYLEQDSRKFILQTSVSSSRASVRFKSVVFEEGVWHHLVLVHRRGRATAASKAFLYLDGEFMEQVKCPYPQSPSSPTSPVQAFVGTPSDLSPRVGRGVLSSQWSVASVHLFDDVLSDDLIAVYYHLGPRYYGNFQDCLGSFQTYEASAALNMRNELMHPGKEEKSDIISAIRHKASGVLPEHKVLMNLSAATVIDERDASPSHPSIVCQPSLNRQAAKNLQSHSQVGPIALNGAVPAVNEALCVAHGTAVLTGDPVVFSPQPLDDAAWRVGGSAAVGLKLVEYAKTSEQICRAVKVLFESIRLNWRNSEAMERDNGFGILAFLLRSKDVKGSASLELLRLVLGFVGYNFENPEESIMINPLAYRILLVDLDLWRRADVETQTLYFQQFTVFSTGSKYRHFNAKRLFRMRIVKKLLFALKGEVFNDEILPDLLSAFKALVSTNMSADVLRSVSLFVTYALYSADHHKSVRGKKSNAQLRPADYGGVSTSQYNHNLSKRRHQAGLLVLEMFSELLCDASSTANIKKFARTVTNKWLLYLLAEDDPNVVVLASKILSRILVVHGPSYVSKFHTKSGGFVIMKHRLKRWWSVSALWPICFSILFGRDIAKINVSKSLDLFHLLDTFQSEGKAVIMYPEMWPVLSAMLNTGVNATLKDPSLDVLNRPRDQQAQTSQALNEDGVIPTRPKRGRRRSLSLDAQLNILKSLGPVLPSGDISISEMSKMLQVITQFLSDIQARCPAVRDFCSGGFFQYKIFNILFPVICSADIVSPETELNSKNSALTFDSEHANAHPVNEFASMRTSSAASSPPNILSHSENKPRTSPSHTGSSFILVTSESASITPSAARFVPAVSPSLVSGRSLNTSSLTNPTVQGLLEMITALFAHMVLERKDFSGLNLLTKIPPGFQEHQTLFESYLFRNTLFHLKNEISLNLKLLTEPRALTNVGKFSQHISDSVLEGWFIGGAEPLLDFVGMALEYLERPDVASLKSVRLCNQTLVNLRSVFHRLVLFRLSEFHSSDNTQVVDFMTKLMYWQTILFSPDNVNSDFTRLMWYLLYIRLGEETKVREATTDLWRILLVHRPADTTLILGQAKSVDHKQLSSGFKKLTEVDNETFLSWIEDQKKDLDAFFFGVLSSAWEAHVAEENRKIEENTRLRIAKRKEKLKQWTIEGINNENIFTRHDSAATQWVTNIYFSEHIKYQRALQDQQDNLNFVISVFSKLSADLVRPFGLLSMNQDQERWRLDMTEGRNRMRKRMIPDSRHNQDEYQPKRRGTDQNPINVMPPQTQLSVNDDERLATESNGASSDASETDEKENIPSDIPDIEDDFELVEDPRDEEDYEDKNRKVMRSLQHGDVVQHVSNVSRLVGLNACEGLLIVAKENLYLIDNFFQRSDAEIVNVWNAPKEERDQYLQIITGQKADDKKGATSSDHDVRHWPWSDVISVSKRKFLFRDVALELFFGDGRSYLLTTLSVKERNDLYNKLVVKATNISNNPASSHLEEAWRVDSLGTQPAGGSLSPATFGTKLANVFAPTASSNPATKRWLKREISNFHYLMLVNTMAGRTFNDLTQYPVFPWVLADYTSEELDLSNPKTFRDLSKPMGAQTHERAREFKERYTAFEDLNDHNTRPFHYGTHYSSAMIVCSFLIRLQPFVQTYLLVQGGSFDHADRLFYSIQKAWTSASRDTTTDVRELIPEFFYLPEFLVNSNNYDFGKRQNTDEPIDSVVLPPWAKGDPKIFIQKHREALESPYVTQHLHEWIDLIFGYKQRGDAAVENVNVFHPFSYAGGIDLDNIEDQVDRVAAIGIIHNFGQTPHQVFNRGHPSCDDPIPRYTRLDLHVESLIRLPFPIMDTREKVHNLMYSTKMERVFASPVSKIMLSPTFDRYMEWGYTDGSVRFFNSESRKIVGHFEHLHQGAISCVLYLEPRTLVTAGEDCSVSVWQFHPTGKVIDLQPKACLHGHPEPVTTIAASRSFSILVTVSSDKSVLVWDLNRLTFIRELQCKAGAIQCAAVNDVSGDIILCSGPEVLMFTLNGDLILRKNIGANANDSITSCASYDGYGNEWLHRELLFTGHKRGLVNIWTKKVVGGKFELVLLKSLQHVNQYQSQLSLSASITCILPMSKMVYTGDDSGRVYQWDIINKKAS